MSYKDSLYGELNYGSNPEKKITIEEFTPDLARYLPRFLCENNTMKTLLFTLFPRELGELNLTIHDLIEQCYIETASWGLDFWELLLGIPLDKSKPKEYRRAIVKAKVRGVGTATKTLIRQVASAFSGGVVEIIEDTENYHFIIKFVGVQGIPPNMMDLTKTIEEIKPAHLTFQFEYTYCIWDWTKELKYTWNKMKEMTWNESRTDMKKKD